MNLEEMIMNQKKRILGFLTAVTKNVPFYFDYTNSSFDNIPIVATVYKGIHIKKQNNGLPTY